MYPFPPARGCGITKDGTDCASGDGMNIQRIEYGKKQFLDLLLLADGTSLGSSLFMRAADL
jgi:hypothetical protein